MTHKFSADGMRLELPAQAPRSCEPSKRNELGLPINGEDGHWAEAVKELDRLFFDAETSAFAARQALEDGKIEQAKLFLKSVLDSTREGLDKVGGRNSREHQERVAESA